LVASAVAVSVSMNELTGPASKCRSTKAGISV
jgi:hypothetical protein